MSKDEKEAAKASSSLARALAARFIESGAKNFISDLHTIKPNDGSPWFEVKVTTQPFDAPTPEQMLEDANTRIKTLEARIADLEQRH
ncbi:hypothetical protein D3C80_957190 [compost metagenome]